MFKRARTVPHTDQYPCPCFPDGQIIGYRIALSFLREKHGKQGCCMQAKDLMTKNVECISPEMPIRDAAQKMKALDVGFLPVCENDRLIGALTDRDIVLRTIANGKDVEYSKARDVMTNDAFWCYEDQTS